MAPSSEKSRAKSWQVMNEPASNHPSPMRKGKVPVPPARPVVSVSRNRPSSIDMSLDIRGLARKAVASMLGQAKSQMRACPWTSSAFRVLRDTKKLPYGVRASSPATTSSSGMALLRALGCTRRDNALPAVHDLVYSSAKLADCILSWVCLNRFGCFAGKAA